MPSSPERLSIQAWKVIGVVILGPFMTQMDSTIVNVSLSSIKDSLHSTIALSQWIVTGYLLALALMLPLNAWLVDVLGAKRLYLVCFASFTAASVLCGLATTMHELIAARVIQGIAGGLLAPLTQLMMVRVAGIQVARVVGYSAAPILLAPLAGPLLAGVILQRLGWQWLFFVNLPVGLLAIALAIFFLPYDAAVHDRRPFDALGFALISPGLALLLYGLESSVHRDVGSWCIFPGLVLCLLFLRHAVRNHERALIDIDLFKIRVFSFATVGQFLSNGIIYGGQFLIPLFLTIGCAKSASETGWILSSMGIGMLCVYPMMGWLTDRFGCRAVVAGGVALNLVGTLPFLWMSANSFAMPLAIAGLVIRGIGQGATGLPTIAAAYAAVPKAQLGLATMTLNIVQRLGGPVITTGIAIAVSLTVGSSNRSPGGFIVPFLALTVVQCLILGVAFRLPVRIHPQPAE